MKIAIFCCCLLLNGQIGTVQARKLAPTAFQKATLTSEEQSAAQNLSAQFVNYWEAEGDLKNAVRDLYAPDFMERWIRQEKNDFANEKNVAGKNSQSNIFFTPGLLCRVELLELVPREEWRQFYLAAHNLLFFTLVAGLNSTATTLLQGKEPEGDTLEQSVRSIFPAQVAADFSKHPILKNFIRLQDQPKPIGTLSELRDVTVLLEQATRLMRQEKGKAIYQLGLDAQRMLALLRTTPLMNPRVEVLGREMLGFSSSARILYVPTPYMYQLVITKVGDTHKILWVTPMTQ